MANQDLNELAMLLAKEAAEKLIRIPGIEAACVTLISKDKDMPLGLVGCQQFTTGIGLRAIARLSDHIEVLTQALLEPEGTNGRTVDGQDSTVLGAAEHTQSVVNASHEQVTDEAISALQEAETREGEQDRHSDRRVGDRKVNDPGATG